MDLAKLLGGQEIVPEEETVVVDGQKLLMKVAQKGQQRQSDIWSWLQTYSRYTMWLQIFVVQNFRIKSLILKKIWIKFS